MKNKLKILIFFVLTFCLVLSQSLFGQKLISNNLPGNDAKILKDGKQTIFVTIGDPAMLMMRDSSNPNKNDIWFVVLTKNDRLDETINLTGEDTENLFPETFDLSQNFPNPFNPTTTINFQIPGIIGTENIRTIVKIYDVLGRVVRTLVDENLSAGFHSSYWDGLNDNGEKISSGVYFYSITAGDFRKTKGMLMLK